MDFLIPGETTFLTCGLLFSGKKVRPGCDIPKSVILQSLSLSLPVLWLGLEGIKFWYWHMDSLSAEPGHFPILWVNGAGIGIGWFRGRRCNFFAVAAGGIFARMK